MGWYWSWGSIDRICAEFAHLHICTLHNVQFELSAKISAMFEIQPFTITYLIQIVKRLISTSGSRGGGATEAMASPKRQTREAILCFGLPQTGQWVYLVSTESTDLLVLWPKNAKNCACGAKVIFTNKNLGIEEAPQLQDESGPGRIDQSPEGRIIASVRMFGSARGGRSLVPTSLATPNVTSRLGRPRAFRC